MEDRFGCGSCASGCPSAPSPPASLAQPAVGVYVERGGRGGRVRSNAEGGGSFSHRHCAPAALLPVQRQRHRLPHGCLAAGAGRDAGAGALAGTGWVGDKDAGCWSGCARAPAPPERCSPCRRCYALQHEPAWRDAIIAEGRRHRDNFTQVGVVGGGALPATSPACVAWQPIEPHARRPPIPSAVHHLPSLSPP